MDSEFERAIFRALCVAGTSVEEFIEVLADGGFCVMPIEVYE